MLFMTEKIETGEMLQYFREISKIPRCSGNEKAISDFLLAFARENEIEAQQDESLNIIMKIPASKGYEDAPVVMLQGHMDMVCVKTEESSHDFENDPLKLVEKDGFICAEGTSLGADNGVALAYIMAVAADKSLRHPELECLVTTSEETGMEGVIGLKTEKLNAGILINLDSEEEGVFLSSSAGGVNNITRIDVRRKREPWHECCHEICIKGLKGGHSGAEIDKGRANAISLMGRLLAELDPGVFGIAGIYGGTKKNAIADRCCAEIVSSFESAEGLKETAGRMEKIFKNEFKSVDPELEIQISESSSKRESFDKASAEKLVAFLRLVASGVQTMSKEVPGLVESSINLGLAATNENQIEITASVRSSVKSLKDEINGRVALICSLLGAEMELNSDYPGWEFVSESRIRDVMKDSYMELYGKEPSVEAIHAGLECGFLKEKMPDLDIIAIGPDMSDVHSTRERLDMASAERTWRLLIKTLENIKFRV